MNCTHCGKRLSRKSARLIDGVVMCSKCMFTPAKQRKTLARIEARSGETACGLDPKDESRISSEYSLNTLETTMTPNETSPDQAVEAVALRRALWAALRFAGSRSQITAAEESAILAAYDRSAIPTPREWQDIATAALRAVNMSAVSIDPETFEHGFHVDWSAIKLVMAALANAESPRELDRRECKVCHAIVATFDEVMCCHCHEIPWARTALELG